ncbi:MAG: hypothetical protein ACWGSQ_10665 [Longimicrobiales bacterium]
MIAHTPPNASSLRLLTPIVLTAVLAAGALCTLFGCESSSRAIVPNLGTIEVTTLTEGPGLLPDSFTVLLDMERSGTVAANGIYTIPFLPAGDYVVALLEDSENCFYGANARTVTVEAEETSPTTFLVRCN